MSVLRTETKASFIIWIYIYIYIYYYEYICIHNRRRQSKRPLLLQRWRRRRRQNKRPLRKPRPRYFVCVCLNMVGQWSTGMYPPPHMACILLLIYIRECIEHKAPVLVCMYPPPHMACILLLIYIRECIEHKAPVLVCMLKSILIRGGGTTLMSAPRTETKRVCLD